MSSCLGVTRRIYGLLLAGLYIRNRRKRRRRRQQHIRPLFMERLTTGEFDLLHSLENDPLYHKNYFRMTKESFDYLFNLVEGRISHPVRHAYPIPAKLRLALTIRYLATGCSQRQLCMSYRVSPASVCNIIREVLAALIETLQDAYLSSPTYATWTESEKVFREKWKFPFCIGAIDGKHVRIKCPWNSGSLNFNYKGFFSVVVLAVVSGDYRFLVTEIGAPGSESDAAIFSRTSFYKCVDSKKLQIPENGVLGTKSIETPFVFVGDEAFPLKPWLMRPFSRADLNLKRRVFNFRLSKARRVVENAFGIWAARWRILFTPIDADNDLVDLIIRCTIILHNFLRVQVDNEVTGDEEREDGSVLEGNWRQSTSEALADIPRVGSNNYSVHASIVRENFTDYFSDDGRLPGQEEYVMRN